MNYFYGYLVTGVLVLMIVYGSHRISIRGKEKNSISDLLESMNPDREKISYRLLNNFVAPFLGSILIVVVWPVAVYMKLRQMYIDKYPPASSVERVFSVEPANLIEKLTVAEIQNRELVSDPLGGAPEVPFGHLEKAWQKFLQKKGESDSVWSFSALWESNWGRKEEKSGYVFVNNENQNPGTFFLTLDREVDGV